MKKNIIAALACTALLMASCNTVTMTSDTLKVASDAQSVTVADLDVKPRKEKTEEWNFVPFNIGQPSLAQRKNNLIAEIVNEQGADILVEPLVSFEKKLFGKRTLTISGRPATFKDFRKPTTSDIAAFNALKPGPAKKEVVSAPQKERKAKPKAVASIKKKKATHYLRAGFNFMKIAKTDTYEDEDVGDISRKLGYDFTFGFQKATRLNGLYWGMEYGVGSRGFSEEWEEEDWKGEYNMICHNIHLSPITLGYQYAISENLKVDVHFGLYVSMDYLHKESLKESEKNKYGDWVEYDDDSESWGITGDDIWDGGIKLGIGAWYKRYNLDLTWQRGFSDYLPYNGHASNVMLRVGVAF